MPTTTEPHVLHIVQCTFSEGYVSGRESEAEEGRAVEEVSLLGRCLAPQPRDFDGAARHAGAARSATDASA